MMNGSKEVLFLSASKLVSRALPGHNPKGWLGFGLIY
jgi:hypothetical protein